MQLDAFMKIEEPPLAGESTDVDHVNQIEILSFEQVVQRSTGSSTSAAGESGKKLAAHLSPVRVIKQLDKATPKLMEAAAKGTIYNKVTLTLCQPGGTADTDSSSWSKVIYYQVILEKAHVSSIRWIGDPSLHYSSIPGGIGSSEELELAFRKISWMYKGGSGTANISGTWNLNTNAPT